MVDEEGLKLVDCPRCAQHTAWCDVYCALCSNRKVITTNLATAYILKYEQYRQQDDWDILNFRRLFPE